MNEKQGDRLDERIRQSLNGLPDAPPPGSTFDAGKLWEQLRPELTAPAEPAVVKNRPRRVAGWLATAAVVGLLLVGIWNTPLESGSPNPSVALHTLTPQTGSPSGRGKRALTPETTLLPAPNKEVAKKEYPKKVIDNPAKLVQPVAANEEPSFQVALNQEEPIESSLTQAAEGLSVPVNSPISASTTQPALIASTPKHRFRVVHENELPTEDEAYQVRYRAQQFVRLGTGGQLSSASDETLPVFRLPLSRKSTQ